MGLSAMKKAEKEEELKNGQNGGDPVKRKRKEADGCRPAQGT
jgi:hypothetical protein